MQSQGRLARCVSPQRGWARGQGGALPPSSSSAKTAVARRKRGSADRAASAAACAMAAIAPRRRHCLRRDQELVGIEELRLPDPAAMVAAKLPGPAFGRPQACHFDAIGCSAVWTDDQHWRIGKREKRTPGTLTAVAPERVGVSALFA